MGSRLVRVEDEKLVKVGIVIVVCRHDSRRTMCIGMDGTENLLELGKGVSMGLSCLWDSHSSFRQLYAYWS